MIATVSCVIFAIIYESFSHGIYSNFMIFAFIIPLILGAGVSYMFYFLKFKKLPNRLENQIYNAGVETLTFGSIIEGVLQIYGTTNSKVYVYLVIGVLLLVISINSYLFRKLLTK